LENEPEAAITYLTPTGISARKLNTAHLPVTKKKSQNTILVVPIISNKSVEMDIEEK